MKRPELVMLALIVAVGIALPSPAGGQLTLGGACAESPSGCSPLTTTLESDAPLFLESLTLSFVTPGWTFDSAVYGAEDVFGPFGGTGVVSGGGSTIFLDFFFDAGFLLVDPSEGASVELTASGPELPSFEWEAVDDLGIPYSGAVSVAPVAVPEPGTIALLAAGILGLAAVRGRRRSFGRTERLD